MNTPTPLPFPSTLESLVSRRVYVEIRYFTDLHQLLTVRSIPKRFVTTLEGEALELVSGELLPLDQLVSVGGVFAPELEEYETCLACHCDL